MSDIVVTITKTNGGDFVTRLRAEREKRNLTISKLSHAANINVSVASLAERKKLAPSSRFRTSVSEYLGISEESLFDDQGFAI